MAVDAVGRTTVLRGPAAIQYNGATIYTKDDIKIVTRLDTFPIETSAYGKVDERIKDIITEITFTPAGEWEAAALSALFPHTNPIAGTTIFGATDLPVTILPLNGLEKMEYAAGGITKMPDIILSAAKTVFGSCTITCLGKNTTAWTDAAKRYTLTGTAAFSDTSFLTSAIKTTSYICALTGGSAPWDSWATRDGITISFNLATTPLEVDTEGIVDMSIKGLDISVKLAPIGVTLAQVLTKLAIQGAGVTRGISLNARAANLTLTGSGSGSPIVVVNSVALKNTPQNYGAASLRHDLLEFVATRTTGTGAMFALSSVA